MKSSWTLFQVYDWQDVLFDMNINANEASLFYVEHHFMTKMMNHDYDEQESYLCACSLHMDTHTWAIFHAIIYMDVQMSNKGLSCFCEEQQLSAMNWRCQIIINIGMKFDESHLKADVILLADGHNSIWNLQSLKISKYFEWPFKSSAACSVYFRSHKEFSLSFLLRCANWVSFSTLGEFPWPKIAYISLFRHMTLEPVHLATC